MSVLKRTQGATSRNAPGRANDERIASVLRLLGMALLFALCAFAAAYFASVAATRSTDRRFETVAAAPFGAGPLKGARGLDPRRIRISRVWN